YFAISPLAPHEQMRKIIDNRIVRERAQPPQHRQAVVQAIRELHEKYGKLSAAAKKNLDLLEKTETVAVVTGQQVGILGGPLYTFYKTLTAIELAKKLSAEYPSQKFVPVFWLETEDHDLEEIVVTHVLDAESQIRTLRYTP